MAGTTIDRRRALLGGATAGAALWVAPQLRSVAAAQTCSGCTASSVNLLTTPFGAGVNFGDNVPRIVNGTTVRATRSNTDTIQNGPPLVVGAPVVPATNGVILNTTTGGISGGQVPLLIRGTVNTPIVLTIDFNPGVRSLSFVLTDIDSARVLNGLQLRAAYQEQVTIGWTGTGTAPPVYTYINPGPQPPFTAYQAGGLLPVPSLPTNTYKSPYRGRALIVGDGNVPVTSMAGNLGVRFNDCDVISQVVITSADIDPATGNDVTQGRMVGLTNLAWCV